jgi:sugar phosphate isomerase/epimerase
MGSPVSVFAQTSNAIRGNVGRPLSQRPVLTADDRARFGERRTAVADATLKKAIRLVYQHHMGTVVQSERDIAILMNSTGPSMHLLLDTGRAVLAGAKPADLARCYRDRISHVHAKDVRPAVLARARAQDWSLLRAVIEGVYTVPGDGLIDYLGTFGQLAGCRGWIVIEAKHDPKKAPPLEYGAMGSTHVRQALSGAGLS